MIDSRAVLACLPDEEKIGDASLDLMMSPILNSPSFT